MFKKTGKTTTLGTISQPKDQNKQVDTKPKDSMVQKPKEVTKNEE